MKKDSILIVCIIALLLLNLGTLGFLFSESTGHKPPPKPILPEMQKPGELIIERLNFDKTQQKLYQELIQEHHKAIRLLENKRFNLKEILYHSLKKEDHSIDTIVEQLGNLQKEIELTHYNHFTEIKAICKPEQMNAFDSLAEDFANIFNSKPPPGRH